jgi:diguanylate cyclase (GGDEF)-like protein
MLDIDNFKKINDTYGHKFGDEVLMKVSNAIESSLRKTDFVGRYGGEEFLVIFTQTDIKGALNTAERIRKSVEDLTWSEKDIKVTISGGVFQRTDEDHSETIAAADSLLYEAKANGKNRVEHNS